MKRAFSLLLAVCLILSLAACNLADNDDDVESRIAEILVDTPACEGWAPSIAQMIETVFFSYEWTYEPYSDSDTVYIVKFSGSYCPNPDIPNLSQDGSIGYLVDIESGDVVIYSDPNSISATFMVYIVS